MRSVKKTPIGGGITIHDGNDFLACLNAIYVWLNKWDCKEQEVFIEANGRCQKLTVTLEQTIKPY